MAEIRIHKLSKTYEGKTDALSDVSVDIRPGEFIVLVGPSGCGKSTLLRLIAGLEEVTSGEIRIDGRVINDVPPARRDLAMVFQDYALYPHMTVRENLAFGLKIRRIARAEIESQIRSVAALLGIDSLLERKPAALSGGQRQRVAIGRAIVRKPLAFLFDEPLSNLDAQLRIQTRIELAALHRKLGTTTLYVTHDQTEAMTLADRIVILDRGRVQQIGSPLELYHHPANRFVASFIGNPGMNFIEGNWDPGKGFRAERFELAWGEGAKPELPEGAVTLGIRPEGIRGVGPGELMDSDATVIAVEPLGHETLIAIEFGPMRSALMRTPGSTAAHVRPGDRLGVVFEREAIRWFSPEDGASLQ